MLPESVVIEGNIFPQKRIHNITSRSLDHVTMSQIDYICIYKKFWRVWKDVSVRDERNKHSPQDVWQHDKHKARYNMSVPRVSSNERREYSIPNKHIQQIQTFTGPTRKQWFHHRHNGINEICKTHVRKSSAKKGSTQKWATVNTLKKMDVRKANNEALNTHQIRTARGSHNYR